jgi:hypothetical protein
MQKSDLCVVQHSARDLREVSFELRLFIESIACSSCPMSVRSSQALSADSERATIDPKLLDHHTRQAFCRTIGASALQ